MLLNQLSLPDLPKTLITSLMFLYRVHPIIASALINILLDIRS
jgi:hypothetical protein